MIAETNDVSENWTRHYDPGHSTHYYFNSSSGHSQWESPPKKSGEVTQSKNDHSDDYNFVEQSIVTMHTNMSTFTLDGPETSPPHNLQGNHSDMDETPEEAETFQASTHDDYETGMHTPPDRSESSSRSRKQDYFGMARVYAKERPYSDIKYSKICVLCQRETADHVFFPCEHHCVCIGCIVNEEICADNSGSFGKDCCCNCPLCGAVIKKILPFDNGNEIELYWAWVYEFPPPLPPNFIKVHVPHNRRSIQDLSHLTQFTVFTTEIQTECGCNHCHPYKSNQRF